MKKQSPSPRSFFIFFLAFLLLTVSLFSQPIERYFDTAPEIGKETRLVIFYPSMGTLRALISLQENGLIDLTDVTVIGVFHAREKTNYAESLRFVKEKKWETFHFHRLDSEVAPGALFEKNAWTREFETIFRQSSGVIFFGGPDIPPSLYGEKTSLLTQIEDPWRHYLELSAIFHLLGGFQDENFKALLASRPNYPVLGICLGCQSLNVGTGGSLTQDISLEIYGKQYVEDVIALGEDAWHTNPFKLLYPGPEHKLFPYALHPIKLLPDGKFSRDMGFSPEDKPLVLSAHHQQVKKPGKGFRVIATSIDGRVNEAFEHELYPHVLAVQFHPEFPVLWDREARFRFTPADKDQVSLRSRLEDSPPSMAFHEKLWAWFMNTLRANIKK